MIIAVANQKGGVAKTTTAINLAASLADLGHRTLLIDLDPQAHASMGLGIKTDELKLSIYNVLSEKASQQSFIENIIKPYAQGFDVAPGHMLLSTIEQEYVEKEQAVGKLKSILSNIVFPYHYIVIDCPPSLGFLTFNALYASDLAVVPVDLGSFALFGVAQLLSMIELIRVKMNHAPQVYALATMVDLRSKFSREMMGRIRSAFKENLFDTTIKMNIACRESQQLGVPIRMHREKSPGAENYMQLAREVTRLFSDVDDPQLGEGERLTSSKGRVRDFIFSAPEAANVHIVGDFNNWRIDKSSRLWDRGKGSWQKRVLLNPGRYRYKFVVDGKWVPDPSNQLAEPNPYGGIDSVVEIE